MVSRHHAGIDVVGDVAVEQSFAGIESDLVDMLFLFRWISTT